MRKAIRRTLVALWCLLSLCLLALWVRGQFRQDQFVYAQAGGRLWQLFSHSGEFGFSTATPWPNAERAQWFSIEDHGTLPLSGPKWWAGPPGPQTDWDILGLHVLSGPGQVPLKSDGKAWWAKEPQLPTWVVITLRRPKPTPMAPVRFVDVYISFWLPALVLGVFPAVLVLRRAREAERQRRVRRNRCLCPACGYDIRATPDATGPLWDRCPECGRVTGEAE